MPTDEKILLVDDDPSSLRILVQTLEGQGYRLLLANSGSNALQVAARVKPALILLDVVMPGIDGFEVCVRLKADPELADIPVIFLSALETTREKVRGFTLGAVDFITKPYQPDEVIARVGTQIQLYRLESRLRESNRQLVAVHRSVVEAIDEGLLALDTDARVLYANPAAEQLLGLARTAMQGRQLRELPLWGLDSPLPADVEQVLAGDAASAPSPEQQEPGERPDAAALRLRREYRWNDGNGRLFEVECSISPVSTTAGQARSGGVLLFHDITPRKQAEREIHQAHQALQESHDELRSAQQQLIRAERLETVGSMAAGVAHEVKNPLAVIQLGADYLHTVLAREGGDSEIIEVIDDIEDAVGRADRVIKGLLDFSRTQKVSITAEDLNGLVEAAVELVGHEFQPNGVELRRELAEQVLLVSVDREQILQVLVNLLVNAVHAMTGATGAPTERGKRVISLRSWAGRWADVDGEWHGAIDAFTADSKVCGCAIDDTGPGIPVEKIERVFEPFFSTKPAGKGTGLGLSVSANIVTLHSAVISIRNRPSGGVCAQLVFRCAE